METFKEDNRIIYGYFVGTIQVSPATTTTAISTPNSSDCSNHYDAGSTENGVYSLYINGQVVHAWCIMNYYVPITLFQWRDGGNLDFFLGYEEYVNGFGDPNEEYWLGLKFIAALTDGLSTGLYMYMAANNDEPKLPAEIITYVTFNVDSNSKFRVSVTGFESDCLNRTLVIDFGNGQEFATFDKDNNQFADCAKSAWWFGKCIQFDLNGPINGRTNFQRFITNENCWGTITPVGRTAMGIIHFSD